MAQRATEAERKLRISCEGRILGLRVNRYSWWVHWRELANRALAGSVDEQQRLDRTPLATPT